MTPTLAFIYAEGCGACEEAKPEFAKLAASLPHWRCGLLNIDKPGLNLDFPVKYTPTLHLQLGDKRYSTDPATLGKSLDAKTMQLWLGACVAKYRSGK